jgi:hypothetical protein
MKLRATSEKKKKTWCLSIGILFGSASRNRVILVVKPLINRDCSLHFLIGQHQSIDFEPLGISDIVAPSNSRFY